MKPITLGLFLTSATLASGQDNYGVQATHPLPQSEQSVASLDQLAKEAKKQEEVQKQAKWVFAQGGSAGISHEGYGAHVNVTTRPERPQALVIPKDASDAKDLGEVEEDMAVMAHILDKVVNRDDDVAHAMGIRVFGRFPGMGSAPQSFYIDGTGAIFLLKVDYPLLPPPTKAEEKEATTPTNSEWEEARREMANPGNASGGPDPFMVFEQRYGGNAAWNATLPSTKYDASKVEALKKDLISALKNAANIRRLKSDETVTVVVMEAEGSPVAQVLRSTGSKAKSEHMIVTNGRPGEHTQTRESAKLILRVRKADATAFQDGKLSFDDFRKKVTTMLY